jgi:hypothetical protein
MIINRILFSIFLYFFILTNSYATSGAGKIKLSNRVIMGYIQYLQMNSTGIDVKNYPAELKKGVPNFFAISQDGNDYGYSYCPRGQSCVFNPTLALQLCKKYSDGQRCYIFDRKRKIVWDNKNYKISRKATSSEIREILDELGFTGTKKSATISSNTDSNSKITKNKEIENNDNDIVKQIQELNEMFKSGVISKEEFDKAKKKILN